MQPPSPTSDSPLTFLDGCRYKTLARTIQKTSLIRIFLLVNDVLSGLLPSDGPSIVDAAGYFVCRGNVFTGLCLVMDDISGPTILVFILYATINYQLKT
jgi:hypothetical protein